ncbi:hypothetical protein [Geobacillus sp. YF-1]|uniref:hypothetical protein n=1 Tax=Geobacillus sp. YF-1 TaxID=3457480 RepID=UPI004045983F
MFIKPAEKAERAADRPIASARGAAPVSVHSPNEGAFPFFFLHIFRNDTPS